MTRARATTGLVLGALVAIGVYWPAMTAGLFYEDVRWAGEPLANFPSFRVPGRWLTHLTFGLQAGASAQALHLVNLGLHLTAAGLVYRVARRWALGRPAALVAAVALMLSPGVSQAVAYASARGELFVAVFALGAIAAGSTPLALALGGVGMMLSKEVGALPGVALLAFAAWRGLPARALVPVGVVALGAAVYFSDAAARIIAIADPASPIDGLGLLARALGVFVVPAFVPPNVDPDLATLGRGWFVLGAVLPIVAIGLLTTRARELSMIVALVWLPRLFVSGGDVPQEHHAYGAATMLALGVGWIVERAGGRSRHVAT